MSGVWVDPDIDLTAVDDNGDAVRATDDSAFGFGLELEYRISRRLGVDFGVLSAEPDMVFHVHIAEEDLRLVTSSGVRFTPIIAALNIHLTPDSPVDLYAGPIAAYVFYDDLRFVLSAYGETVEVRFDSDGELAWGAALGADVKLGGGAWFLTAGVRYLETSVEITNRVDPESTDVDFDPLIVNLGVGLRF